MWRYTEMKVFHMLTLLFLLSASVVYPQQKNNTFEITGGKFIHNGKPIHIRSGEMHYARIPHEYWRHRLKMLRAMGLNAVATYVFWNYHHPAPGRWDFTSGNKNIKEFIRIAGEEGLLVILRPGPYACAEWEFGGYPWWLQQNPGLVIRANNKPFLDSCRNYIQKLAGEVRDLQISRGGPVVMVQVENEFGSYVAQRKDIPLAEHRAYNRAIYEILKSSGLDGPFFTSDGSWLFEGGSIEGVLPTANGEGNVENLKKEVDKYHHNQGPYMVAEYYPGWLDHWGEPFVKVDTAEVVNQLTKYMETGTHFNIYMAHGGTNFGFTSGANYNNDHHIQPDITSYDYDAPISEAGWATPKFFSIRRLFAKYSDEKIPDVPNRIPVLSPRSFKVTKGIDFFQTVKTTPPVTSDTPRSFEELGQGHGYILYSKTFSRAVSGMLKVNGLRDYARVFINGIYAGELNRQGNLYEMKIEVPVNATLDIFVENLGRINYGADIVNNRKGIISPVFIDDKEITGDWKMYKLPFDKVPKLSGVTQEAKPGVPALYTFQFKLAETGDTFLDMRQWGKGIVFVNGVAIGRYWNIGPQQTLYLPGCWLKKGKNEIVVFELKNEKMQQVLNTTDKPILEQLADGKQ